MLDSKAPLIASLANALPPPHRFMPRSELAGEIEWAKNRMIPRQRLPRRARRARPRATDPRRAHAPASTRATSVARSAPARSTSRTCSGSRCGSTDDVPGGRRGGARRFQAFTVDEYQDVNPLQQALLERVARRPRRTLRGGRRLPDDLLVHGRLARATCSGSRDRYPRRHDRAARGELPLHAAGARASRTRCAGSSAASTRRCAATMPDGANPTGRAPSPTPTPRSRFVVAEVQRAARRGRRRWRRSRSCIGSTPAPSRTRRRSPRPASRIRCATARSSGGPGRAPCSPRSARPPDEDDVAMAVETRHRRPRLRPGSRAGRCRGGHAAGRPRAAARPRRRVRGRAAPTATSPAFVEELGRRFSHRAERAAASTC